MFAHSLRDFISFSSFLFVLIKSHFSLGYPSLVCYILQGMNFQHEQRTLYRFFEGTATLEEEQRVRQWG